MKVFIVVMMVMTVINSSPLPQDPLQSFSAILQNLPLQELPIPSDIQNNIQNIIANPGDFLGGLSPDIKSTIDAFGGLEGQAAQNFIAGVQNFLSNPDAASQISTFLSGFKGFPVPRR